MATPESRQELHEDVYEYAPASAPVSKGAKKASIKLLAAAAAVGAVALVFGGVELRCTRRSVAATQAVIDVRATSLVNSELEDVSVSYRLDTQTEARPLDIPAQTLTFAGLTPATTYHIIFTVTEKSVVSTVSYPFTTTGRGAPAPDLAPDTAPVILVPPESETEDPPPPDIIEDPIPTPKPQPEPQPDPAPTYTAPTVSALWYDGTGGGGTVGWSITANDGKNISCTVSSWGADYTPEDIVFTTAELDASYAASGGYAPSCNYPAGTFNAGRPYSFTLTVSYTLGGAAGAVSRSDVLVTAFASGLNVGFTTPDGGATYLGTASFTISADALNTGTVELLNVTAADSGSGELTPGEPSLTIDPDGAARYSFTIPGQGATTFSMGMSLRWTSPGGVSTYSEVAYAGVYNLG